MNLLDLYESRDMCNVCGQTPCNCTHLTEGVANTGRRLIELFNLIYSNGGDDAVDYLLYNSPIFADYYDQYEGDLESIAAEVNPKELQVMVDELEEVAENEGLAEDAVADFVARGGKIQHGKTHPPRKAERWQGSAHIGAAGGKGSKGTVSGLGANTNPKGGKPVVTAEGSEFGGIYAEQLAQQTFDIKPDLKDENEVLNLGYSIAVRELGPRARGFFRDEDFPSDFVSAYGWLQDQRQQGVAEGLNEFAPGGGGDNGGGDNRSPELYKIARKWYNAKTREARIDIEDMLYDNGYGIKDFDNSIIIFKKSGTLMQQWRYDELTDGLAEGSNDTVYPNAEVIKSKNGKPVGEIYQDDNGWGCFHYRADRGYDTIDSREDAIQALKDLHQETGRNRPDYTIKGVAEVSDATLTSYLTKVDADSQKHEKDPTKRSPEKRNKSVQGFARAFNKLDARKEPVNEISPEGPDSDEDYREWERLKDVHKKPYNPDWDDDDEEFMQKWYRERGLEETTDQEADYGKSYQDMVKRMGAKAREQEQSRPVDIGDLARRLRAIEKKSGN